MKTVCAASGRPSTRTGRATASGEQRHGQQLEEEQDARAQPLPRAGRGRPGVGHLLATAASTTPRRAGARGAAARAAAATGNGEGEQPQRRRVGEAHRSTPASRQAADEQASRGRRCEDAHVGGAGLPARGGRRRRPTPAASARTRAAGVGRQADTATGWPVSRRPVEVAGEVGSQLLGGEHVDDDQVAAPRAGSRLSAGSHSGVSRSEMQHGEPGGPGRPSRSTAAATSRRCRRRPRSASRWREQRGGRAAAGEAGRGAVERERVDASRRRAGRGRRTRGRRRPAAAWRSLRAGAIDADVSTSRRTVRSSSASNRRSSSTVEAGEELVVDAAEVVAGVVLAVVGEVERASRGAASGARRRTGPARRRRVPSWSRSSRASSAGLEQGHRSPPTVTGAPRRPGGGRRHGVEDGGDQRRRRSRRRPPPRSRAPAGGAGRRGPRRGRRRRDTFGRPSSRAAGLGRQHQRLGAAGDGPEADVAAHRVGRGGAGRGGWRPTRSTAWRTTCDATGTCAGELDHAQRACAASATACDVGGRRRGGALDHRRPGRRPAGTARAP